ncbi:hypothetical protein CRE_09127 [Caenorhabditis remanei]|nr:hypothetical protein CRE_09127 [Caenorhabditis remanei]
MSSTIQSTSDPHNFWYIMGDFIGPIVFYIDYINLVSSIIGVAANIFHVIVLTRKSMRALTINVFMCGIAVFDLERMLSIIILFLPKFYKFYQESQMPEYCIPPESYFTMLSNQFFSATFKISQEISVWLGVTMAILRVLVIRFPLNPK